MSRLFTTLVFAFSVALLARHADAQMVTTSVPFQSSGSGFFENNNIGGFLQGPHGFANFGGHGFGGQGPLLPPFGGATGGGGLSGGVGFAGGGFRGGLGFNFAQGSSQTNTTTVPSLTTTDGYPGSISSGTMRPFVLGFTPVVGAYTSGYSDALAPLESSRETAAQIGWQQISSLRNSQAALRNSQLERYLHRAEQGVSSGNKRMARANYRHAIAIAPEPLRTQLQIRLNAVMRAPARKPGDPAGQ